MKRVVIFLALLPLLCVAEEEDPALELGNKVSQRLMETLGSQLVKTMEFGGPEGGVRICSTIAQELTRTVQEAHPEVKEIKRVTEKWRNPDNRPDSRDLRVLWRLAERFAQDTPDKTDPVVEKGRRDEVIYYRPLAMKPVCLKCHGNPNEMSPELRALINDRYPKDTATGYQTNDFRGAIKVTIKSRAHE